MGNILELYQRTRFTVAKGFYIIRITGLHFGIT
jgi:hypothetical protein